MTAPMRSGTGKIGNKIPSGYRAGQIQKFTPEQMQLFSQLFPFLGEGGDLQRLAGGDQSFFDQIEAPAKRQFNDQLSNIATRFSGMGSGARRSSGFQNATTSAASNFAQELQSNRQALQRQAMMDLFGLSNQLLNTNPYDQFLIEKQQKPSFFSQIAPWAGAATGGFIGGPSGAKLGFNAGSAAGQYF